jgi:hypothetical protein
MSLRLVSARGTAGNPIGALPGGKTLAELAGLAGPAPAPLAEADADPNSAEAANLYRGRRIDPATSAASAMLRRGNVEVRVLVVSLLLLCFELFYSFFSSSLFFVFFFIVC